MSYKFADNLRVASGKTPDDGQRNCPKHVEFYSKNKFEKLVHLVGFITRIYHDARSPERQKNFHSLIQLNITGGLNFTHKAFIYCSSDCILDGRD
jgi:hypothetical protein